MSADEVRCACPDSVLSGAFDDCFYQFRVIGKAEIIIAAKCEVFTSIHGNTGLLGAFQRQTAAVQPFAFPAAKLLAELFASSFAAWSDKIVKHFG